MWEKSNQFLEDNREAILQALVENPMPVLSAFFKHPAFSLNYEIPGIQPMNGPKGIVFYWTIKDEREPTTQRSSLTY
jgi:hypothetical protein